MDPVTVTVSKQVWIQNGKEMSLMLGTSIKAKTVCVWGQVGQKHVCREMTTWEMDSEGNCVCEGNAGREGWEENRVGDCPRGPGCLVVQLPFFKCHMHHSLKVASLTLKDSYED